MADAEIKGHDAENNDAGRRGAPLGKRGGRGDSAGEAQPSARVRQEKGGGVCVAVGVRLGEAVGVGAVEVVGEAVEDMVEVEVMVGEAEEEGVAVVVSVLV